MVAVLLNGLEIEMEVDTGTSLSVISETTYHPLMGMATETVV